MDGLERMDSPRRWPLFLGVALVVVVVGALLFAHFRSRPPAEGVPPESSPRENGSSHVDEGALPATPAVSVPSPAPVEPAVESPSASTGIVQVLSRAGEAPTHTVPALPAPARAPEVAAPPAPTNDIAGLIQTADALLADGKKDKAREAYLAILALTPGSSVVAALEAKLGPLNVELITHPWPMAEKQDHVVQEGDSVKAIARKYGTTVELIVRGNQLKRPDMIRPGQHLKVFAGRMAITVGKSRNELLLSAEGRFFKRYRVGTGRYDKTPLGSFAITERIPEPPWWRDDGRTVPFGDKENILGTRWMAIKATGTTPEVKGYGIHGTWDTNSIGKAESSGCIRLRNEDAEELFDMVPVGTPVVIEE